MSAIVCENNMMRMKSASMSVAMFIFKVSFFAYRFFYYCFTRVNLIHRRKVV